MYMKEVIMKKKEILKTLKNINYKLIKLLETSDKNNNFIHPEDIRSGFPPFWPQPRLQGEPLLSLNEEVIFVDNNGRNVHGFISYINEDLIEITQLDIFDNPTKKIFRFNKIVGPQFLKRVLNYGV